MTRLHTRPRARPAASQRRSPRCLLHRALLLSLPLLSVACVKSPPVFYPKAVTAPPVPLAPPLADEHHFGYLRAHHLVRTADRLGLGSLLAMFTGRGIDLAALDPDKLLVVVVGDPRGGGVDKAPIAALIPVPPGGQLGKMLTAVAGAEHTSALQGSLALALNRPRVDATHGGPLLERLAAAPLDDDVQIHLNVAGLMDRYGQQVRSTLAQLQAEMDKNATTPVQKGMGTAYMGWVQSILDGMAAFTIASGTNEKAVRTSFIGQDRGAGPLALPAEATSLPNLAQFVEPGDMRFEVSPRDAASWKDLTMKLYEAALKDDPPTLAQFRDIMNTLFGKGRLHMAGSFDLGGDRLVRGTTIMLVDDAEARFEAVHRMLALGHTPSMERLLSAPGFRGRYQAQLATRKIEGWPVDRVTYQFDVDLDGKAGADLKRLLGRPFELDVMRLGSYLIYTVNAPAGSLENTVKDLLSGKGPHGTLAARADHPDGGYLYADLDIPRLLAAAGDLRPGDQGGEWPALDPTLPRITFFGYAAGPVSYHRMALPLPLINAIRDLTARQSGKGSPQFLPTPQ